MEEKFECLDECPSYDEFKKTAKKLKELIKKLKSELDDEENEDIIMEELMDLL